MMVVVSKIVTAVSVMVQTWALMLLFSICFLALWSSFALLQLCGQLEGGVILWVMLTTLIPYPPLPSKFVESPKLAFFFIIEDVFLLSSYRLACQGMSFKTYQA
jgi:hypothetical protein